MRTTFHIITVILLALAPDTGMFAQTTQAAQQSINASPADALLDQAFLDMYNLKFDEAMKLAETAKRYNPEDPLPWMAQACAALFREFDRLHILSSDMFTSDEKFSSRKEQAWIPQNRKQFEDALNGAEKLGKERLASDPEDPRALFVMTLASGLRADDAALIAKKNMGALSFTKTGNQYAEKLLARHPDYYDAYVATGLGKYIIGGKAAPVRWMLRLGGLKGDQEEGVKELRLVAQKGHYLAPYARILLAFDDLRRKDKDAARKKFAELHQQFPGNPLFTAEIEKIDHPVPKAGG
ncbi:MAG TPA: hypothetical protein VE783_13325 [Candidatus Limnocylindrales bacterium]|nr:hypothetical protein [Candidatus Limnocylindrales bacterium]